MTSTSRRGFLAGGAMLPAVAAAARIPADVRDSVAADLDRYIGFGSKQAGGIGDEACGAWLATELERAGYTIERQRISVPFFTPDLCEIVTGAARAPLWPQPIVTTTNGVTGPIVRIDPGSKDVPSLAGAIALIDLPHARWSTALAKPIRDPVTAAFAAGAKAAIVITNGPTGKVIALNADGRKPMFAGPVGLLAPERGRPFLDAAMRGDSATVRLTGKGGQRPAFNFVGRLDRGRKEWLAMSTPRSGWYGCAGERGPGVAIWLLLARWASRALHDHNLAFVCNTGHEYEYLGAAEALKAIAPKPADTAFWLHLGASAAAQDWHDVVGALKPLPNIDSQRFLSVSPTLLPLARRVFAGHVGFEAPYSSDVLSAGEQTEILAAGYRSVAGVFGTHRFHHVADDDARCVSATNVAATAAAFQHLLEQVVARMA